MPSISVILTLSSPVRKICSTSGLDLTSSTVGAGGHCKNNVKWNIWAIISPSVNKLMINAAFILGLTSISRIITRNGTTLLPCKCYFISYNSLHVEDMAKHLSLVTENF